MPYNMLRERLVSEPKKHTKNHLKVVFLRPIFVVVLSLLSLLVK
jgi:hypothetical protein